LNFVRELAPGIRRPP